jgi:hypothetical protein
MTKFLQGSFSVGETPGLDEEDQARRWEQTFGKREDPGVATESKAWREACAEATGHDHPDYQKPGTFDTAAARSNASEMTAALNGPDWKLAQKRLEEALAPIRKDIAEGQAENVRLKEKVKDYRRALERVLAVTEESETAGIASEALFGEAS